MFTRLQKMGQEANKAAQTAESWCTFCLLDNWQLPFFLTPLFAVVDIVTYIKRPLMYIKKMFWKDTDITTSFELNH